MEDNGRGRLVASCLYPVEEGLIVKTKSERIMANLEMTMELLLARCPNVPVIQDLAKRLGVDKTAFKLEDERCILCGLCVRACEEVVGVSAISLVSRGVNREIAAPFYEPSDACIGCGSCAALCQKYFEMGGDGKSNLKKSKKNQNNNSELEIKEIGCIREAVEACPVQIIHIEK